MKKTKIIVDYRMAMAQIEVKRNTRMNQAQLAKESGTTSVSLGNWYNHEAPHAIKALAYLINESGLTFEEIVREVPATEK